MVHTSFTSRLRQLLFHQRNTTKGFTLLELLVVTLIAGGLVSGLLFMVIELTAADRKESSLSETQRDMQTALDYISSELREAVYVYSGACLAGAALEPVDGAGCSGLANYLPTALSNGSVPIIAFWKQQPLPPVLKTACAATPPPLRGGLPVPCLAGKSYALVVYSLSNDNAGNIWAGRARITRYALTEFDNNGNRVQGYVPPGSFNNWMSWPFGTDPTTGATTNLQNLAQFGGGRPTGTPAALVDFVDDGRGALAQGLPANSATCPNNPGTADQDYDISPTPAMLNNFGFGGVRSFYSCVSLSPATQNQDVILFLRGNAYGRPAIKGDRDFIPTMQTRILNRGVLQKTP